MARTPTLARLVDPPPVVVTVVLTVLLAFVVVCGAVACDAAPGEHVPTDGAVAPSDGAPPDARVPPGDAMMGPDGGPTSARCGTLDPRPHVSEDARAAARAALGGQSREGFAAGFDPDALYADFEAFADTHFGASQHPLVYEMLGETLAFVDDGRWSWVSSRSLALGFSTSLPTRSYVEHGPTPELGSRTETTERYFYNHLHRLDGLAPGARHYVRVVAYDERGHAICGDIEEVTAADEGGVVEVPGALAGPPYRLDREGATYLLTEDVSADGTAFIVEANDVTLDLGGHVVTYSAAARATIGNASPETAQTGVYARGEDGRGLRVVNGSLREGHVGNAARVGAAGGLHAIYLQGWSDVEVAGVTIDYHGAQVYAVFVGNDSGGVYSFHHDQWVDRGWQILDRHGSGGSRCLLLPSTTGPNAFEIRWNLVKRARHTCFNNAGVISDNEVYGDSWATNGFLLTGHSRVGVDGGVLERNRVFMTGYHAIGFGWTHQGYRVRDNLVVMENVPTARRRWWEDYGDHDSLNGFRVTNYGSGGQVRDDLRYEDNYVLGTARSGGTLRGAAFFSDSTITNVVLEGGRFLVVAGDDESLDVAPIVTQGVTSRRREAEPLYYRNVHLASNIANVRFGDSYGKGDNHRIERCVLERVGAHPDYHTFVFDGTYDSRQHVVLDPTFVGGARYDDVWWRRTGGGSAYTIAWTLTLSGPPGAPVEIRDVDGALVHSGALDGSGALQVPLMMSTIRRPSGGGVLDAEEVAHTPHRVTVSGASHEVTMDEARTLSL